MNVRQPKRHRLLFQLLPRMPEQRMIQLLANSSDMPAASLAAFHNFLTAAGVSIRFQTPVPDTAWNLATCSRIMIIALRSRSDVLSGTYSTVGELQSHVANIAVDNGHEPTIRL
jgi:hypothetical protein